MLAAVMFGAIFLLDISMPLGVAGGVPYVAVVLLGLWFGSIREIFGLAIAATLLTILGFLYSPDSGIPWVVLTNRGLALFAIWAVALLLVAAKRTAIRDMAEQRRMEEQLRQSNKMEALGRLAGGVAHEFNNLLLPIITLTEASLKNLDDAGKVAKNLQTVLSAAKKGNSLIAKIMGFSRQQPSNRRSVMLNEVIAEAITVMGAALPSGIKIKSRLETFDQTVFVDPAEIHQVVLNLGANAANAIGSAGGEIEIGLRRTELSSGESRKLSGLKPGMHALLTVRDTGCGMDSEVKAKIFDPLFTTQPGGHGTGMGLSIVHTIIQGHDAAISVHSEVGKGTTFEIYLPLTEPLLSEGKPAFDGTAYPEGGPVAEDLAGERPESMGSDRKRPFRSQDVGGKSR